MLVGCAATGDVTPKSAVQLPPPPSFMAGCAPSQAKVGDQPNVAFDAERDAFKACSRAGEKSRSWYKAVRARYGASPLSGAR